MATDDMDTVNSFDAPKKISPVESKVALKKVNMSHPEFLESAFASLFNLIANGEAILHPTKVRGVSCYRIKM